VTLSNAERLLECAIEDRSTPGCHWYVAIEEGKEIGSAFHPADSSEALKELVNSVYQARVKRVYRSQDYKCFYCGKRRPLTPHHEKFRSHGGTHVQSNIVGACISCHDKKHKERSK